jgi:microcystin-dependent protein
MADPFIGEIRMTAISYPQKNWAFCNGQVMQINQNQALFALVGTYYGGDGASTFALPDMRGRVPIHEGAGYSLGLKSGVESITLSSKELPAHNHTVKVESTDVNSTVEPQGNYLAQAEFPIYGAQGTNVAMGSTAINSAGESQPHTNMQPYGVVNFIIALDGTFPSRS